MEFQAAAALRVTTVTRKVSTSTLPINPLAWSNPETHQRAAKAELIHKHAPWKSRAAVELATLEWVSMFHHAASLSAWISACRRVGSPPARRRSQFQPSFFPREAEGLPATRATRSTILGRIPDVCHHFPTGACGIRIQTQFLEHLQQHLFVGTRLLKALFPFILQVLAPRVRIVVPVPCNPKNEREA